MLARDESRRARAVFSLHGAGVEAVCVGHCRSGSALPVLLEGREGKGLLPGSHRTSAALVPGPVPGPGSVSRPQVFLFSLVLSTALELWPDWEGGRAVGAGSAPSWRGTARLPSACGPAGARGQLPDSWVLRDSRGPVALRGVPAPLVLPEAGERWCRWLRSGQSRGPGGDTHRALTLRPPPAPAGAAV